nr:hypothetical protein [Tanacetum cinerariifolium]
DDGQVDGDQHDRHQGEGRRHGHIADGALLRVDHAADEVTGWADQLRHDEVTQGQREREDRTRSDAWHRQRQDHVHEGLPRFGAQ